MRIALILIILCWFSASAVGYVELYPIVPTGGVQIPLFPDQDYDYCDMINWDESIKYLDYSGNIFTPSLSDVQTALPDYLTFFAPPRFTEGQEVIVSLLRAPTTFGISVNDFSATNGGEIFWKTKVINGRIGIKGICPPEPWTNGITSPPLCVPADLTADKTNMAGMSVYHDSATNQNFYVHPFNHRIGISPYNILGSSAALLSNIAIKEASASWGLVSTHGWGDMSDIDKDGKFDCYSFLQLDVLSRVDGYQPYGELNIIMLNPYADRDSYLYEGKLIQWTGFEVIHSGGTFTLGKNRESFALKYVTQGAQWSASNAYGVDTNHLTPLKDAACLFPSAPYLDGDPNEFLMCLSAPPYACFGVNSLSITARDIQCPLTGTDHMGHILGGTSEQHYQRYIPPCKSDITNNSVADVHYYTADSVMDVSFPTTDPFYRVPDAVDNKPLVRCWFAASNNLENIYKNNILADKGWANGAGADLKVDGSQGINDWAPVISSGVHLNLREQPLYNLQFLMGRYICIKIIIYTNSNTCDWIPAYTDLVTNFPGRLPGNAGYRTDPTVDVAVGANPASSVYFSPLVTGDPFGINNPRPYFFYNDRSLTPQIRGLKMYFAKFDINIHLTGFNNFMETALDGTKYEDWRVELGKNQLYEVKKRK